MTCRAKRICILSCRRELSYEYLTSILRVISNSPALFLNVCLDLNWGIPLGAWWRCSWRSIKPTAFIYVFVLTFNLYLWCLFFTCIGSFQRLSRAFFICYACMFFEFFDYVFVFLFSPGVRNWPINYFFSAAKRKQGSATFFLAGIWCAWERDDLEGSGIRQGI